MPRNLRVFGLALVALFAVSAVAAAMASAAEEELKYTPAQYPATLTGTQAVSGEHPGHVFEMTVGDAECRSIKFHGTIKALGTGDKNVTLTPEYKECETFEAPSTINMTGCDFVLHHGETNKGKYINGTVDLVCPGAVTGPDIVVYADEGHTEEICTLTLSGFLNKKGNTYENVAGAPNDVTMTSNIPDIPVKRDGSILCGKINQVATYKGLTTLEAFEDLDAKGTEGKQIGLTISD